MFDELLKPIKFNIHYNIYLYSSQNLEVVC